MHPDIIGWMATLVLVATLLRQMVKQWRSPHPETLSRWLFAGQMVASALFTLYSLMLGSSVFVVTNLLLLATALLGQVLARHRQRQAPSLPPVDHRWRIPAGPGSPNRT